MEKRNFAVTQQPHTHTHKHIYVTYMWIHTHMYICTLYTYMHTQYISAYICAYMYIMGSHKSFLCTRHFGYALWHPLTFPSFITFKSVFPFLCVFLFSAFYCFHSLNIPVFSWCLHIVPMKHNKRLGAKINTQKRTYCVSFHGPRWSHSWFIPVLAIAWKIVSSLFFAPE